ncbi:hypothetical protein E6P09_17775 (plasmid) [Haloferax mediterranei ATCC 33500]|uniref:Uncharacterized protein n=1 Tax=Haloferax mediterranei (strain ATCC 33500 / DSM 1411 / JCM 8866 / NBRC 14739 / NCIMB 2177 / R-4) TaxID=523841 RepID=M0J7T4_HALMT|nr:hypothetical protein [Haloferax mediterranei]AHZ24126.1 hypothetical protein BM92_18145 [Haloferax mediterranei ATCC 33500]EMA05202.1 hypothetical protein C439_00345 [Haloferax mediterranei ATCC 33500]MDX5989993.1 hypothetical protein [Haloferax mediterranei ATCC 33500]QCQ77176.1 hypothetical protein E6P09_17775 [Haloferax mediterranei ATCC 33500]
MLWTLIALGWTFIPADHPAQIAVVFSGIYGAILLPIAVYFDRRERIELSQSTQPHTNTKHESSGLVTQYLPCRGDSHDTSCLCNC